LFHPIAESHEKNQQENPVDAIGQKPTVELQVAQPVQRHKEDFLEKVLNAAPKIRPFHIGIFVSLSATKIQKYLRLLTSFFGKSKPVHFLVLSGLVLLYWCLANFLDVDVAGAGFLYFLKKTGLLLVFLLSVGLLNFICKRNTLTKKNSFAILLFIVFSLWFPAILKSGEIICAVILILLALRRIFSLKSGIDVKKKIFDASLWICVAAFFMESSLLFFPLLFLAVLLFAANDYRNWIIPLVGMLTVFVLYLVFHLIAENVFSGLFSFFKPPTFDFSGYGEIQTLVPLSIFLAFSLWSLGDYIFIFKKTKGQKNTMGLVMACFVVSALAVLFSSTKNTGELLFMAIPVSILGANFFQRKKDLLFKEILLATMIILALMIPFWE
jgi:hypothetical protein